MKRLEGKVAVVTGGNSGIGLATAKARLQEEEGAKVAISPGAARKRLDEAVKSVGNGVVAVQSDVASLADIDKLFGEVSKKLGKIDVLFVNAGIAKFAPLFPTLLKQLSTSSLISTSRAPDFTVKKRRGS